MYLNYSLHKNYLHNLPDASCQVSRAIENFKRMPSDPRRLRSVQMWFAYFPKPVTGPAGTTSMLCSKKSHLVVYPLPPEV